MICWVEVAWHRRQRSYRIRRQIKKTHSNCCDRPDRSLTADYARLSGLLLKRRSIQEFGCGWTVGNASPTWPAPASVHWQGKIGIMYGWAVRTKPRTPAFEKGVSVPKLSKLHELRKICFIPDSGCRPIQTCIHPALHPPGVSFLKAFQDGR